MKIAMISEGWEPIYGGGQIHVKYLCEGLVKNHNCRIDLFVRKLKDNEGNIYDKNEYLLDGKWSIIRTGYVSVFYSFFYRLLRLIQITRTLYRKAKKEKYDLIHGHALLPGIPIKIISFLTGIPCVYTVHGTMHLDSGEKNLFYYIEKFLVCGIRYDLEISVSRKIYEYNNINKNIKVLSNGVDIKSYNKRLEKKYFGCSFLTVARIDRQKNHKIILEALKDIDKKYLEKVGFVWNIVGDGPLIREMEELIKKYKLEKNVILKGKKTGTDLIKEYKKSRVFILPSLAEGQPLTLLEAFASKLPVIVTNVGENKFFVKNNINGKIINAGSIKEIKEALLFFCESDRDTIEEIGDNNYNIVKDYDRSNIIDKTYKEYKML